MLEKWLSFADDNNAGDLDETFYEDLNSSMVTDELCLNDEFVTRLELLKLF